MLVATTTLELTSCRLHVRKGKCATLALLTVESCFHCDSIYCDNWPAQSFSLLACFQRPILSHRVHMCRFLFYCTFVLWCYRTGSLFSEGSVHIEQPDDVNWVNWAEVNKNSWVTEQTNTRLRLCLIFYGVLLNNLNFHSLVGLLFVVLFQLAIYCLFVLCLLNQSIYVGLSQCIYETVLSFCCLCWLNCLSLTLKDRQFSHGEDQDWNPDLPHQIDLAQL